MSNIIIGKSYIEKRDNHIFLCADINDGVDTNKLYFETEQYYENFLNTENNDAFLLALLNDAMFEGKDIISELPISERLLFQIRNYYIPVVSNNMPELHEIEIIATPYKEQSIPAYGVATGCSGGVDSFYTMLSYRNLSEDSYKLTHVIFNNISTADNDDKRIRDLFERDITEKKLIADKLGLKYIWVFTNLYKFYKSQFIYNYYFAAQYVCIPYVLDKLIGKFYYSSGVSVSDFSMNREKIKDSAYFDLFSLVCFSTNSVSLYSAGSEVDRFEKLKHIVDDPCVRQHLQVCSEEQYSHFYVHDKNRSLNKLNCGKCGKCVRTISSLYSIGKIDDYEDIFDLTTFRHNVSSFIGHELAHDAKTFSEPIIAELKSKKLYKKRMIIWKAYWTIHDFLWINLRKNAFLKKVYRTLKYGNN